MHICHYVGMYLVETLFLGKKDYSRKKRKKCKRDKRYLVFKIRSLWYDIISDKSNQESLKLKIETDQFNWEKIVPVASSHLVIPLLYCKLEEKDLLDSLPKDLRLYLEEITNQNRDRNKTILREVKDISLLLNKHDIEHVFLKGAALLASGVYKDDGERMIGDIDILVHPKQLFQAQDLLVRNGYKAAKLNFGSKFSEHKHLARLIPETKLTAVEIHRKLLRRPVKDQLEPLKILHNKRLVSNITIAKNEDLLIHTILNFEVNDYGYYYNYLGLRNTYDVINLMKKMTEEGIDDLNQNKYFSSFINKAAIYFIIPSPNNNSPFQFSTKLFLLKQKSSFIRNSIYKFLNIWQFGSILLNRFFLFIRDSDYRKDALKDRTRIFKNIKLKLKSFY